MIVVCLEEDVHKEVKAKEEIKPKEEEKTKEPEKKSSGSGGTEGSSARKRKKDKKQVCRNACTIQCSPHNFLRGIKVKWELGCILRELMTTSKL